MSILPRNDDQPNAYRPLRALEPSRKARKGKRPRPITRPRPRPVMRALDARIDRPASDLDLTGFAARTSHLGVMTDGEFGRWAAEQLAIEDDGFRPTAGPDFEPTPEDHAAWTGFCLGVEGAYPSPPEHYTARERYWFTCGRLAGFMASPEGIAWQQDMAAHADRVAREIPFEELVEAGGIDFARSMA